ncbi:MAG: WecB/TagA/CpsF family glycosyltransferase [Planctomycetes bacterium]|nr:WecB/TagA/CpsF family glycosyltransferase [Planctomycetota bacterium]
MDDRIRTRRPLLIGVVNASKIVNMRTNPALRESVLAADLVLADGMSIVWASRLLGEPLPERVAGIDLMLGMFQRGEKRGYRVFCLGATQEILNRFVERTRADFPGLQIVGAHHGYFSAEQEPEVAAAIGASNADILLAAMSSPKKEKFLARWSATLNVSVCHGVGGSFDVVAGLVRRAPAAWQRFGLEWLYRLLQEPRRLGKRYLVTNTVFAYLVCRALLARVFGRPRPSTV